MSTVAKPKLNELQENILLYMADRIDCEARDVAAELGITEFDFHFEMLELRRLGYVGVTKIPKR